ncbi:hypothetical protein Zm00014a_017763 [Zea mays]|uniref:Uncharacterized protein n=1 Tax=Zea mays TaxID=4577 RepID=A0A3L6FXC7_MAIZE|nr:hypothetical protein Zm00014a_017763 [Zea mays]
MMRDITCKVHEHPSIKTQTQF